MPPPGRVPDRPPSRQPTRLQGTTRTRQQATMGRAMITTAMPQPTARPLGPQPKPPQTACRCRRPPPRRWLPWPLPRPPRRAATARTPKRRRRRCGKGCWLTVLCARVLANTFHNRWASLLGGARLSPLQGPKPAHSIDCRRRSHVAASRPTSCLLQERRNAVLVPLLKGAKLAVAGPGKASPAGPKPLGASPAAEAAADAKPEAAADGKPDGAAAKPAAPAAKPAAPPAKPAAVPASAPAPPAGAPAPSKPGPKALYLPPSIR